MAVTQTQVWGAAAEARGALARRKLRAFARIEEECIVSFQFVAEVHGQRRFTTFGVAKITGYLHALVLCSTKDHLLSVPQSVARYEGPRALKVMRDWQDGDNTSVIAFLHDRLDHQPFAALTRAIAASQAAGDTAEATRLIAGRAVLLNRLFTLAHALDAVIGAEPEWLRTEVRAQCRLLGHTPAQIARQLASLRTDLFSYAPHPDLARRNMLVMNAIGRRLARAAGANANGARPAKEADGPWEETLIPRLSTQLSLRWRPAWSSADR